MKNNKENRFEIVAKKDFFLNDKLYKQNDVINFENELITIRLRERGLIQKRKIKEKEDIQNEHGEN